MRVATDLAGRWFGRLFVLSRAGSHRHARGSHAVWLCRCDCGKERTFLATNLVNGRTASCGCLRRDLVVTHGQSSSSEYSSWQEMKRRCENPKHESYVNYGGRGISVCEKWHSFDAFFADMGKKPSVEYTIERLDNHQGYEPSNCKWATHSEQNRHKRMLSTNTSGITGVYWSKDGACWHAKIKVGGKSKHLGSFHSKDDAVMARKMAEMAHGFHPQHGGSRHADH